MKEIECPHCGMIIPIPEPKKKKTETKKEQALAFLLAWNQFAQENGLPSVRENNERILATLAVRAAEKGFAEDFQDALLCIKAFSFYRGLNDSRWKASLEYLARPGKAEELAAKFRAERKNNESASERLLSRTRGHDVPEEPGAGGCL